MRTLHSQRDFEEINFKPRTKKPNGKDDIIIFKVERNAPRKAPLANGINKQV